MIHDSVLHMNLADVSGLPGYWRRQTTQIRPVVVPWNKIDNHIGKLTSSANLLLSLSEVCGRATMFLVLEA